MSLEFVLSQTYQCLIYGQPKMLSWALQINLWCMHVPSIYHITSFSAASHNLVPSRHRQLFTNNLLLLFLRVQTHVHWANLSQKRFGQFATKLGRVHLWCLFQNALLQNFKIMPPSCFLSSLWPILGRKYTHFNQHYSALWRNFKVPSMVLFFTMRP